MTDVRFLTTSKGGRKLLLGGFLFRLNRKVSTKSYWKCETAGCKSSAVLDSDNLHSSKENHGHPPISETEFWAKTQKAKLKKTAREQPLRPIPQIYNDVLKELNSREDADEAAAHLSTYCGTKSSMYRERSKRLPPCPKKGEDVNLEAEWATTQDGRPFLLCTSDKPNKIIVLGTDENLQRVCDSKNLHMDGTFKICPGLFYQLYVIHAFVFGRLFPMLFCFLPGKQEDTYVRLLKMILTEATRIGKSFAPESILIDFETSVVNAIRLVLPLTRIRGCFFHFGQAVWRKVQSFGLAKLYKEDEVIRKIVRRISAFPLAPPNSIDEIWLTTVSEAPSLPALTQFFDYLVDTWLDDITPRFSKSMWNHWDNDNPRTNNTVEGWHSGINRVVKKAHPNIFELVDVFKGEQAKNEALIRQCKTNVAPLQRKKYREMNEKLSKLKEQLRKGERSVISFTDAASFLVKLSK